MGNFSVCAAQPGAITSTGAAHLDAVHHSLAALATTQHGVVSREQLSAMGFSDGHIAERCRRGFLFRIGPSVFAVGHTGLSRRARGISALLHAGQGSALSHETAARLWGLKAASTDGPIHVSVTSRSHINVPEGVLLHRPRTLTTADLMPHRGLSVTTPERTIIDSLRTSEVTDLTRMLEQLVTNLGRSPDELHAWAHGLTRRPGRSKLLQALDWVAGPAVIRSEFEELFRSVCQAANLPQASTNYRIDRWEVDAVYPEQRVAIELDSWRWHGGRWQFHQDRRKGLAISRAGYELIRLSWWQLKNECSDVTDAIGYALARGNQRLAAGVR